MDELYGVRIKQDKEEMLKTLVTEISTLREEISQLKKDVSELSKKEPAEAQPEEESGGTTDAVFPLDLITEVTEEPVENTETEAVTEEPAESIEPEVFTEEPAAVESGISSLLLDNIKSVLLYVDKLLEALPEAKISEFANSDYFRTYKNVFKELGLA